MRKHLPLLATLIGAVGGGAGCPSEPPLMDGTLDEDGPLKDLDPGHGEQSSATMGSSGSSTTLFMGPDPETTETDTKTEETDTESGYSTDTDTDSAEHTAGAPPLPVDDSYSLRQGETLSIEAANGVLHNDTDPEGAPLRVAAEVITTPVGATVELDEDGSFTYAPPSSIWGEDSFVYTVSNSAGVTATATVTLRLAPVAVALASLGEHPGGMRIQGVSSPSAGAAGRAVHHAGDVNGDDLGDIVVGAPWLTSSAGDNVGHAYVVFGSAAAGDVLLADLSTEQRGFEIRGESAEDYCGAAVAPAGDLNGDGLADVILGAPGASPGDRALAGQAYVVYGRTRFSAVDLEEVGRNIGGFRLEGRLAGERFGSSVAAAGDVNGDGLADIIVGAPGVSESDAELVATGPGRAYVIFGTGDATTPLPSLEDIANGQGGFLIEGEREGDAAGISVARVGDMNHDGFDDLIIGAFLYGSPRGPGRAYVVWGTPETQTVSLTDVALGTGGFAIEGEHGESLAGQRVSAAGDVNGDGTPDVVLSAPAVGALTGRVYVIFGKSEPTMVRTEEITAGTAEGFTIYGEEPLYRTGTSLSPAGDMNGDGLDDILIGARTASVDIGPVGKTYVVFGRPSVTAFSLSEVAEGNGGFVILGEELNSEAGLAVSGGHDVHGDGHPDVLIGAWGKDSSIANTGQVYVLPGGAFWPAPEGS